jgi:hypothetical protein
MKQEFVYHQLARREPHPRHARTHTAATTVALKEYIAYIATLSIAVVIAIITFAYAANITVRWLDAVVKPGFLAQSHSVATQPDKLAMLPAAVQFKKAN